MMDTVQNGVCKELHKNGDSLLQCSCLYDVANGKFIILGVQSFIA